MPSSHSPGSDHFAYSTVAATDAAGARRPPIGEGRRRILHAGLASAAAGLAPRAFGQAYPSRPVRCIVPFAAAGPTDAIARRLADLLSQETGQQFLIDNKPGAGGAIGTAEVARAAPDGYTLGMAGPDALISTAALMKNPGFDARSDLTMIMQISAGRQVLVANPKLGIGSLTALIEAARARPKEIAYVSWGPGSRPELLFKVMGQTSRAEFTEVPYKGLGAAVQDLLAGNVHLAVIPLGMAVQYAEKGAAVPIAVIGSEGAPELPTVKSSREQGFDMPIMNATLWTALFGPKGLPAEISRRWVELLQKVMRSAAFEQQLKAMGQTVIGRHGPELAREFAGEFLLITELSRKLGLEPQ